MPVSEHTRSSCPHRVKARAAERPHLQTLLQDPNPDDPLNKQAATMLQNDARQFESTVRISISRGTHIEGSYFPPCRAP